MQIVFGEVASSTTIIEEEAAGGFGEEDFEPTWLAAGWSASERFSPGKQTCLKHSSITSQ